MPSEPNLDDLKKQVGDLFERKIARQTLRGPRLPKTSAAKLRRKRARASRKANR